MTRTTTMLAVSLLAAMRMVLLVAMLAVPLGTLAFSGQKPAGPGSQGAGFVLFITLQQHGAGN